MTAGPAQRRRTHTMVEPDELTYQGQEVATPPMTHIADRPWVAEVVALAGLTISAGGVAQVIGADPKQVAAAVAAGLGLTGGRAVVGLRANHQRRRTAELATRIFDETKLLCDVRLKRWRGVVYPDPTRIVIKYPLKVQVDPFWTAAMVALCEKKLGMPLAIRRHDVQRHRLVLTRSTSPVMEKAPLVEHPTLQRATSLIHELVGADAAVEPLWADEAETELKSVTVNHRASAKVAGAMYQAKVERVLSTMLPGRWRTRWNVEEDYFVLEQRPVLPHRIDRLAEPVTEDNLWRIKLAVGEDGQDICWEPRDVSHLLVVGGTNTGKTVAIQGVAVEASRRGWLIRVVDPKAVEFLGLRDWPNVEVVATRLEDQLAVIYSTWQLMEDRYALIVAGRAHEDDFQPVVLIVDEYRDLHSAATDWWSRNKPAGATGKCPAFEKLFSLGRKARTARIHLVLGTQRPDAEFLTGEMRDNFKERLSLGRLSPEGAKMMWDSFHVGLTVPRKIKGRAIGVDEDEHNVESQVLWTPDPRKATHFNNTRDLALLDALRPTEVTHPRMQVELDQASLETVDNKGRPRVWDSIVHSTLVPYDPTAELEEPPPAPVQDSSVVFEDDYEGYDPAEPVSAGDLEVGDLIEHDDRWVVIERVLSDGELLGIDWRDDDDESGSITASPEEVLDRRQPIQPTPEPEPPVAAPAPDAVDDEPDDED